MNKTNLEAKTRFIMTKKHHKKTFNEAKKQGKMDLDFIPLCEYISKTNNFFTSSCCAGRICLVGMDNKETKKESMFHRKWHRKVNFSEVKEGIESYLGDILWFKQEPLIFHIGTNNLENAKLILKICEKASIKRAGIKVAKEGKFIIEMVGTHNITLPARQNKKTLINDEYLKFIIKKSNEKFLKNKKTLKKLETLIKKEIK